MLNRQLIALNLLVASATGFLGGYLRVRQGETQVHDEIRTRRLLVVDERGEIRGGFEVGGSNIKNVGLWMHWGGDADPNISLTVDELEGTPVARIMARSSGVEASDKGISSMQCMSGRPTIALTESSLAGMKQAVHLGTQVTDEPAVLSLQRPGQAEHWPK